MGYCIARMWLQTLIETPFMCRIYYKNTKKTIFRLLLDPWTFLFKQFDSVKTQHYYNMNNICRFKNKNYQFIPQYWRSHSQLKLTFKISALKVEEAFLNLSTSRTQGEKQWQVVVVSRATKRGPTAVAHCGWRNITLLVTPSRSRPHTAAHLASKGYDVTRLQILLKKDRLWTKNLQLNFG